MSYVLAIDEGSTGVRAVLFDRGGVLVGRGYERIETSFPQPGWVEQDPLGIWEATLRVARVAMREAGLEPAAVAAIGVANQRSTVVVWERRSGRPVYPAIGWQDARTAERAEELLSDGIYTNSMALMTKAEWILDHIEDGFGRAARGELCCGTIDAWLVWGLSGGKIHVTDHSNASCTALYDFVGGKWDENTMGRLRMPVELFPVIRHSSEIYGRTDPRVLGAAIPLAGIAGDQQAAMFGELAVDRGAVKVTYGTSGMVDINTGDVPVLTDHGTYPLVLWSLDGCRPLCLEGTVVTAGAAVQWLCDGLGLIRSPSESAAVAASVPDTGGVWALPALQGLGTPHLQPGGRAMVGGLSRTSTRRHFVRAVLEGIAFRTREVLDTLAADAQLPVAEMLRVDGGAAENDFLLQCLADVTGRPVQRPAMVQATALGVAYLAGLAAGVWEGLEQVREIWQSGGRFTPRWTETEREERFGTWQKAARAGML